MPMNICIFVVQFKRTLLRKQYANVGLFIITLAGRIVGK